MRLAGTYVSVWDKGVAVERACAVDLFAGPLAVVLFDPLGAFDHVEDLVSESIRIGGLEFPVTTDEGGDIGIDDLPRMLSTLANSLQEDFVERDEEEIDDAPGL